MKPTLIPAEEYLRKEITQTNAPQEERDSVNWVNTWAAIHRSQEPTRPDVNRKNDELIKHNTISDCNTYAGNQTWFMSMPVHNRTESEITE